MSPTILEYTAPEVAIDSLIEGNQRFIHNIRRNRNFSQEVYETKDKQEPFAVVISCMDSRTSPELIFDQGLGDLFSIRIAGNVITPEVIGSAEYACKAVGSKVILVLGHLGCGAIRGAMDNVDFGQLSSITNKIKLSSCMSLTSEEVTIKNVRMGMRSLIEESSVLKELVDQNKIKIIGGIYDISNGQVSLL